MHPEPTENTSELTNREAAGFRENDSAILVNSDTESSTLFAEDASPSHVEYTLRFRAPAKDRDKNELITVDGITLPWHVKIAKSGKSGTSDPSKPITTDTSSSDDSDLDSDVDVDIRRNEEDEYRKARFQFLLFVLLQASSLTRPCSQTTRYWMSTEERQEGMVCRSCGETGHMERDCSNRKVSKRIHPAQNEQSD